MNTTDLKLQIENALKGFANGSMLENGIRLLNTLGYTSERQVILSPNTFEGLADLYPDAKRMNPKKSLTVDAGWLSVDILFQLTGDDLRQRGQGHFVFEDVHRVDNTIIESYLFMAIRLKQADYTRGKLADATREINKIFAMPVMVLFQYGEHLTLSIIQRRLNKKDESRDVLEKVTLIKDISIVQPHRGHIEIIHDLALEQLSLEHPVGNWVELQRAWEKVLDTTELNKKFYREVANWYFWAVKNVVFPKDAGDDVEKRNAIGAIRLITRLIFVWFLKEKGLVPDDLFNQKKLEQILNNKDFASSTYYKAILQNLFFATLNQEMNSPGKRDKRDFRKDGQNYNVTNLYRYKTYFKNQDQALELFQTIPFLNGGLFECLDKTSKGESEKVLRVDGFSDRPDNELVIPDWLFFSPEKDIDLNEIYDTRNKHYKVRGLIDIFNSYKFTIEENTPIEEEIALDPELLGRVFENLLAAYNPETGTTARKQTGSFYTPREIVNYMVDEALITYLETKLEGTPDLQPRLRHLLDYNQEPHQFSAREAQQLIDAIDAIKVLDPACGSGAFPMGVLHKLVFILTKLDPGNVKWKKRQLDKAGEIPDATVRDQVIKDIEKSFTDNEWDYGRKLYLIENCIYGVDIQPIAVQIAKLRFFISLVVDQKTDRDNENLGIRPLPNLETKFVAANTLIGIKRPENKIETQEHDLQSDVQEACDLIVRKLEQFLKSSQPQLRARYVQEAQEYADVINAALQGRSDFHPLGVDWIFNTAKNTNLLKSMLPVRQEAQATVLALRSQEIKDKEDQLAVIRRNHFSERKPAKKREYREKDRLLRAEISEMLKNDGWGSATAAQLAAWDPYDQNSSAPFFDPEWMFGVGDGFNVVIGNPPYVSVKAIASSEKRILSKLFYSGQGRFNLFTLFLEKGFQILKPNGTLTFIIPEGLYTNVEYRHIRKLLLENTDINQIVLFTNRVFEAAVDTSIIKFTKSKKVNNQIIIVRDLVSQIAFILQNEVLNRQNFIIPVNTTNNNKSILEKVDMKSKVHINDILEIQQGIIYSGRPKNEVFSNEKESDHYKKCLDGRDILKWYINWEAKLENRYIAYTNKLHRPREERLFLATEKIILPRKSVEILCAYDNEQYYALNTAYVCLLIPGIYSLSLKYILACLNSRLYNYYYQNTYLGWQITIPALYSLPIVIIDDTKQENFSSLVDKIICAKHTNPAIDTSLFEAEIDRLVYELFDLSEEEIALIESGMVNPVVLDTFGEIDNEPEEAPTDVVEQSALAELPAVLIETTAKIQPGDYNLYKCEQCGKMVNGFSKKDHEREAHRGKAVEWQRFGK